ncbi:MAG: ATP-binding cassette domain-containing protein [Chitinivibrionales bacterium]|nr:ATP-binding cassette domain-containing protein [Chitinivibrionales bacterium]
MSADRTPNPTGAAPQYSVETNELTKVFGTQTAVDHISVHVRRGEIYGFLGANGAGKTTAIRMLCGLLKPTSGSGQVAGFDIMKQTDRIRTRIGYMSQRFSLYTDLTVEQNMRLYGSLYRVKRGLLAERIDQLCERIGLNELRNQNTGSLPWGWQQRLSLACANLHSPRILFLDEPTGSVDPVSRRGFWDLIYALADDGATVFITTHHLDEAENCDRVSIMSNGRIIAVDSPRALKRQLGTDSLEDAFIGLLKDPEAQRT